MLEEHIERFIEYLCYEKRYSSHTIRAYVKDLKDFSIFISKEEIKNLESISKKNIHQFLYFLSIKKYSNKSVARKLAAVKSFFNFLVKKKYLQKNIIKSVPSPKLEKKLPSFLNQDQISLLLNLKPQKNSDELRDILILELFYSTGVRISELVKIKINEINLNKNTIDILGKGNKKRVVIFGNYAKKRLLDYLNYDVNNKSGYLFEARRKSKQKYISQRFVFNVVKKYVAKVTQNEKISPHSLRHTFATHLLNNGADLISVKEFLGHANLSSTQIYAHVNIEQMKKVFKRTHPHAK